MGIYLNPGLEQFNMDVNSEIYVDKSGLIKEVNKKINTSDRYIAVSRPRRFGKSMAVNMLSAYYSRHIDSDTLFCQLEISKDESYSKFRNKFNVIKLNIQSFLSEASDINVMISLIDKELIPELLSEYPDVKYTDDKRLNKLLDIIFLRYGDKFIFLIDEWDCLLREKSLNIEEQKIYLDYLRNLLKDKPYVALAYITGILPVKKYGTHSALNMFDEYSMIDPGNLANYVGFTEEEVKKYSSGYGVSFDDIKKWYDGYCFKKSGHIYNPRSVVSALTRNEFASYWTQTETYEALRIYIDMNFEGLRDDVIQMLTGNKVKINIRQFQNDMTTFSNKDDVLTLLVHLGYLAYDALSGSVYIPNHEIQLEFEDAITGSNWTNIINAIKESNRLLEATIKGDSDEVSRLIDKCHQENTSILNYNDENSLSMVISLAYYSARNNYELIRELPTGKGFADIVFVPKNVNISPIIIELKWDKNAYSALKQIKEKNYTGVLKEFSDNIILVGINYDKNTKKHECIIENTKF